MRSKRADENKELLREVAMSNSEPLVLRGHRNDPNATATWGLKGGKTATFTLGKVKQAREEIERQG